MPRNAEGGRPVRSDPDDAPELTDDFFDRAAIYEGDRLVRPVDGRLTRRPARPGREQGAG